MRVLKRYETDEREYILTKHSNNKYIISSSANEFIELDFREQLNDLEIHGTYKDRTSAIEAFEELIEAA